MINQMSKYSSIFMRSIRSIYRRNYDLFQLSGTTCSWIIALGIRKRLRTTCYRRSKAGTKLFHCIHTITTNKPQNTSDNNQKCNRVHLEYLLAPTINNNRGISALFSHINARSIYPKVLTIQQHVSMMNSTLCAITETWLPNDKNDLKYKEVPPPVYRILSHPCSDGRRGGGIAIVHKKNVKVKDETPLQASKIMEYMKVNACPNGITFEVYVLYRYPGTSFISFCEELPDILENNITKNKGHLLLLGDFNIHLDKQDLPDTIIFQDFMDSFGLMNHIIQPTHTSKHMLDLVISQPELSQIVRIVELSHFLSDHCFTHVSLFVDRPIPSIKHIKYWKLKSIDQNKLNQDLAEAFNTEPESHMDRVLQYNTELRNVMEKHAPEKSKYIRNTHQEPWFNDNIKSEIVLRREDRIWRRNQTLQTWDDFYTQCRQVANSIKEAQCNHYKQIIKEHKHDYKTIFNIANGLLFRKQESVLPPIRPISVLAEDFSEFFQTKIDNIMEKLKRKSSSFRQQIYWNKFPNKL